MKPFMAEDIRFTTKSGRLYVFCLGWPERDVAIRSLGRKAGLWQRNIERVRILGSQEQVIWSVDDEALRIRRPERRVSEWTLAFEVS
jgi:alpha-L-fucosidase